MTTDSPQSLVPRLRFPEFIDAGNWNLRDLSSVCDINPQNDGLPKHFIYINLESVKNGLLVKRNLIRQGEAPSRAQRHLRRKDIIYQTVRPYQRNNLFFDIDDGYEYVASTGYAQLQAHESPEFLYQLIHTESFLSKVISRCTGSNYPAINSLALASIDVLLPDIIEQQKIADCLGSLDDLIVAESRKLEALREHKQGLMQQLFPLPDKTMPKLRFPEFQGYKKWETRKLGDLISRGKEMFDPLKNCDKPLLIELDNIESRTGRLLCVTEIGKQKSLKSRFQAGDVLFGKLRPYLQKFARPDFQGVCTSEIWVLRSKEVSGEFLFYMVQMERFIQLANISSGSRMPRAEWKFLADADFEIPHPEEQRKIADCLCSLDDLIAAMGHKIEILRQHKQGLMQQLFPSV